MSKADKIIANAKMIRTNFLNPPNAVTDEGIDLKRNKKFTLIEVIKKPFQSAQKTASGRVLTLAEKINRRAKLVLSDYDVKERIVSAVAEYYNVTPRDIRRSGRKHPIVLHRQMAAYLCRDITGKSFHSIGKYLRQDHTTVIFSVQKIRNKLLYCEKTQRDAAAIRKIYECYRHLVAVSTITKPDLAVQLQDRESSQEQRVLEMADAGSLSMADAETKGI